MKNNLVCLLVIGFSFFATAQVGNLSGKIFSKTTPLEFANIQIEGTEQGAIADADGTYLIENIPEGEWTVVVSFTGYVSQKQLIKIDESASQLKLDFDLGESQFSLNQVVVTGTKTFKRQTQSPVIVNVIDSKALGDVQACSLSEGLRFQPGLRVETDCQTCNYTQLRMNGLGGGYSQILINGRPIFSPLTGLYGMEQVPTNMIDRIEVVRGGGSSLYGSSAIGGTVNVITKVPDENSFDLNYTYQSINGEAAENILSGNATALSQQGNAGISFFINRRERETYDHNGDNFSEIPELKNSSMGANLFFQPTENQKIEMSVNNLYEYRYGGEMVDGAAHLALQSEERTHNVWMGNIDYQINFNADNSSFISYIAAQNTERDHYTGIFPDDSLAIANHLVDPPYGVSDNTTFQAGVQLNHRVQNFFGGTNVLTVGGEYVIDDVLDEITAYRYKVDQLTKNAGGFLQSDWEVTPSINLLTGVRFDKHNLVDQIMLSPRVSFLYKLKNTTQFRLTWGTGFRAPQAFDADLHIAFAGGGISRIGLSPDLKEERSNSWSGSVNYDLPKDKFIVGFTAEGFYTYLQNAFFQESIGEDTFGELFEKRNGEGATVQGATLEVRANYNQKIQLEGGFTLQTSKYDESVVNIEGVEGRREFLRTPNQYGYAMLTIIPNKKFNASANLVYTGNMEIAHFAGAPEQNVDEYLTTPSFTELSLKAGYTFDLKKMDSGLEVFGGVKNVTNAYQNDFDSGKNRDSNYVYGPSLPRTFFVGLRLKSF
ncbi:MAG: TonB-dependent receptor [Saprospiraceae bacterium]